jgi:hypothetical protein
MQGRPESRRWEGGLSCEYVKRISRFQTHIEKDIPERGKSTIPIPPQIVTIYLGAVKA